MQIQGYGKQESYQGQINYRFYKLEARHALEVWLQKIRKNKI